MDDPRRCPARPSGRAGAAGGPVRHHPDRGSAAVEFALVVPLLVLLVVATFEISRAYHTQIALTAAAREGVRVMAVTNQRDAAVAATRSAAPTLSLSAGHIEVSPPTCTPDADVTVQVTYRIATFTGLLGQGFTLSGRGVMRCGG